MATLDSAERPVDSRRGRLRDWLGTQYPRLIGPCFSNVLTRLPIDGSQQRRIALTFDDGPHPVGTERLVSILDRYHVPATFFLIGREVERYPRLASHLVEAGHQVANHSQTHFAGWSASRQTTFSELTNCQQILEQHLGLSIPYVRPPFGQLTKAMLDWSAARQMTVALWDLIPPDYNPTWTTSQLVQHIRGYTRDRSVICLHDNDLSCEKTYRVLEEVIPYYQGEGWVFELLPLRNGPLVEPSASTSR